MGALSGITSLAWAIAPLIFNNLYAITTDVKDRADEERWFGFTFPVGIVWGLMMACGVAAFAVSLTVPDPRVIWIAVPDDNSGKMTLLGDSRDKIDDWKVATPSRAVMGEDGMLEKSPSGHGDEDDEEGRRRRRQAWYRAPLGARCCDRMCCRKDLETKDLDTWWASVDSAAVKPRREDTFQSRRHTRRLAKMRKNYLGRGYLSSAGEGLLMAGVAQGPGAGDYRDYRVDGR